MENIIIVIISIFIVAIFITTLIKRFGNFKGCIKYDWFTMFFLIWIILTSLFIAIEHVVLSCVHICE